jgi:hypothetical protein
MWRGSGRRIAGIGSASAKTPPTGSEGEPGIASTARGSEPGYPIRPPSQTTAEPGPSPRCNGARKARRLRSDPRTDPLCLSKEVEAVACSRALSRRTRRTSPDAECFSSTNPALCGPASAPSWHVFARRVGAVRCRPCRLDSWAGIRYRTSAHSTTDVHSTGIAPAWVPAVARVSRGAGTRRPARRGGSGCRTAVPFAPGRAADGGAADPCALLRS